MRARHACLSRRAPRFILAGALGSPRGGSRVSDCVRQADAGRVAGAGPGLGPPPLPLFSHAAPQARACVSRSGGPGASAPSPARTFSRARSHAAASASTLWLRDDGLGRVPAAGPSARGGRRCPGQLGGSSMSSSRGGVCPPRRLIQAPSRCLRVGGRSAVPFAVPPELGVPQAGAASPRGVCPSPRHLRSGARPSVRSGAARVLGRETRREQLLRKTRPCREEEAGEQAAGTRGASA